MEQTFFPVTRREAERIGIQYSSEVNKSALFPSRLRELRAEKRVSQEALSKVLGVSKSTIGLWENGDTLPDAKSVCDLAAYYGVSTDFLLGKTDISSADMNTREICERTGLSGDTVTLLSAYSGMNTLASSFIARFFEDVVTGDSLTMICDFLRRSAHAGAIDEINRQAELDGLADEDFSPHSKTELEIDNIISSMNGTHSGDFKISAEDAHWYFLAQAQSLARGSIDTILENMEEELCKMYISDGFVSKTPQKRIWRLIEDDDE